MGKFTSDSCVIQVGCIIRPSAWVQTKWSSELATSQVSDGAVRGVLAPILDHYAVGFRVMHEFSGATGRRRTAGKRICKDPRYRWFCSN